MSDLKRGGPKRNSYVFLGAAVFLIVSQIVVIRVRTDEIGGSVATNSIRNMVGGIVFGLLIAVVIVIIFRMPSWLRDSELERRFPHAVILSSGRNPALKTALQELRKQESGVYRNSKIPQAFTLVCAEEGVRLWFSESGQKTSWLVSWKSVESVEVGDVLSGSRWYPAILIAVHNDRGQEHIVLPFFVGGAGLGGLYSQSRSSIERIVEDLNSIRATAAAQKNVHNT